MLTFISTLGNRRQQQQAQSQPATMDRATIEKLFTFSMLYVTFPNANEAKKVTEKMIEQKMTTFVNIVPTIITMYRMKKDENEIDSEVMMIAKIKTKNTDAIMDFVTEAHPYDVPEIYTVPIINLNKQYDQHLKESLPDLMATNATTNKTTSPTGTIASTTSANTTKTNTTTVAKK